MESFANSRGRSATLLQLRRDTPKFARFLIAFLMGGVILTAALGVAEDQARQRQDAGEEDLPPTFDQTQDEAARRELDVLAERMREKAAADMNTALTRAKTADPEAVARAFSAQLQDTDVSAAITTASSLEKLGDLDGDGAPELIFRWSRAERFPLEGSDVAALLPDWTLFLLSWDGAAWCASKLMGGEGLYELDVLPKLGAAPALAVIEGLTLVPYPVIFRFEDHAATLAWDSRDEESRYQGFVAGKVEFYRVEGEAEPVMVVSGKADPGFFSFSRSSTRGFLARTAYYWDGKSYVPRRTEYSDNEDYVLYRFIAALHLHDYRGAYALIDPSKFLKNSEPSLEIFQKYVEDHWPEFLKNNIFEARDDDRNSARDFSFELSRSGKVFVYQPEFSHGSKPLLTGLERREE